MPAGRSNPLTRRAIRRRTIALLGSGCIAVAGCYQHTTWSEDFSRSASARRPHSVRLELRDRTIVDLDSARIIGDSIIGKDTRHHRSAYALRDVQGLTETRFSGPRTAGLIVGGAFTAVVLFVAFVVYSLSTEPT